jgi:rhodanese-related sulfurtransferase/DNA-binding transcriptional ArsR family regulator
MTRGRAARTTLNEQFARIGKALSSPRRIELLDLLAQGERPVESLATASDMSVALASSHLQVLRAARLVEARRDGQRVHYRLAGDDVYQLLTALRAVARERLAELEVAVAAYLQTPDELEPVTREELWALARSGAVTILDVRPREEYLAGHIPGALSVPLDALDLLLTRLPLKSEIVAYCRGPYCVLAPQGVAILRIHGHSARRLADGFPEWRMAGLPIAVGPAAGTLA